MPTDTCSHRHTHTHTETLCTHAHISLFECTQGLKQAQTQHVRVDAHTTTHGQFSAVWRRGVIAHQVVQDGDGEIQHAHLDGLSEGSVQIEQGLGFHAAH